jgi:signal transduction histidine kinase
MSLRAARLSRWAWPAAAAALIAAALAAEAVGGPPLPERVGDLAAGLALLGGGAVAAVKRPRAGAGPLLLLTGAAWFAGDLAPALLYAHRGPLVHLLLTYPSGRTRSRVTIAVIAAAYADGLIPDVARSEWTTLALMAAVVLVAAWRRRAAGGAERRARGAALAAAVLLAAALGFAAAGRLLDAGTGTAAVRVLYGTVAAIACGLTADLLWGRWGRAALTGFVIDLGDQHEPRALRAALARTLGDPSLELAYRIDGGSGWVDEAGRPVAPPVEDGRRALTLVGDARRPVAALLHDPAAPADRQLVAALAAAARLAVANVSMQAEIAARVQDVAASRQRLVEAGDAERRRLGELLGEGPEARLAAVGARLEPVAAGSDGEATAILQRLSRELATSRAQLHDLANGIRPRTLTAGGLRPALAELAAGASVPVDAEVPGARFAPALELVAYFVCSEALANIAKHAGAAQARITLTATERELRVLVADDGAGGADARDGSGLRGLGDRVEALGGRLRVQSPRGGGTRIEAVLPIAGAGAR